MPVPYNSILNPSWYSRLQQDVREGATAGIRGTGSETDDPFWKAREQQGLGDLAQARQQAIRDLEERGYAIAAQGRARDKAYQERATWGLKNMNPQAGADTYLGTQAAEPEAAAGLAAPAMPAMPDLESVPQAPQAYRAPMSAQGLPTPTQRGGGEFMPYKGPAVYNPSQFKNPGLEKRKKRLDMFLGGVAQTPIY